MTLEPLDVLIQGLKLYEGSKEAKNYWEKENDENLVHAGESKIIIIPLQKKIKFKPSIN